MFVVGDWVIVCNIDNWYYCGRVIEINNGLIKILFDNGIEISVSESDSDELKVIEDIGLIDVGVILGMYVIVFEELKKIGFVIRKIEICYII